MKRVQRFSCVFLFLMVALFFYGCSEQNHDGHLGDGKVDAVEAASIRVAVGAAFAARPETVLPAYEVSKAILALLGEEPVGIDSIEEIIAAKVDMLDLDPVTKLAFADLVTLVKVRIEQQLPHNLKQGRRLVVVKEIVKIINKTAKARMALIAIESQP